jgi:hypothetical protein
MFLIVLVCDEGGKGTLLRLLFFLLNERSMTTPKIRKTEGVESRVLPYDLCTRIYSRQFEEDGLSYV